jgi:acetoacetyl-CoA reductase/3-oxoacyl-[acyl-carrier protein] reductase
MVDDLLQERVALVTGGTKGIGKAICTELAQHGARVACLYGHDRQAAEAFHKAFVEQGHRGDVFQCDVGEPDQVAQTVELVGALYGRIDILINNAGITRDRTVLKMEVQDWQAVLQTNLSSAFLLCQAVLPTMVARQYGRIVNISSVIGLSGNIGQANYASAKAGLIALTKTLALETARKGITVNAVAPGFVQTEMTEKIPPDVVQRLLDRIPMRRFADPGEVARLVRFLAAEESAYITGQVYGINGGLYL